MRRGVAGVARPALVAVLVGACAAAPRLASITPGPSDRSSPPSGAAPSACPTFGVRLPLGSDRLVGVTLAAGPDADTATFQLGPPGPDAPATVEPEVLLGAAEPPFSHAGSGSVFDVSGSRYAEVRFIGMTIADAAGRPTFDGLRDLETEFAGLRQLTVYEEVEGVVGWVVGIEGRGCVTLAATPTGDAVVLSIEHP